MNETKSTSHYRKILGVAWPLFCLSAGTVIMQFCDRKFLGNSSTEEIAAALPAGNLLATLGTFFISMISYCNPMTAQYFGAGRTRECVDVLWSGFRAALLCAGIMAILMSCLGICVLNLTLDAEIFPYAFRYFVLQIPGQIMLCLAAPFFAFYSGRSRTIVVSCVNICAALLNILLDWLLIFGHWGFPKLGITGAGMATTASQSLAAFTIIGLVLFGNNQARYPTRRFRSFSKELFRKIFLIGGPSGFQRLNNSLKFTTIILLVGTLGKSALASSTIALSITLVSFMPLIALTESNLILSGQFLGRGDPAGARKITFQTWTLAFCYTLSAFFVILFFSRPVIAWFAPERSGADVSFEQLAGQTWNVLLVMGFWMMIDSVRYIFGSLLRAAGDTGALLKISLTVSWGFGIPGFVVLTQWVRPPIDQIWLFFILVSLLESSLILYRFHQGNWKTVRLIHQKE